MEEHELRFRHALSTGNGEGGVADAETPPIVAVAPRMRLPGYAWTGNTIDRDLRLAEPQTYGGLTDSGVVHRLVQWRLW